MFYDNLNFESPHEGIYIYRNFVDDEYVKEITDQVMSLTQKTDLFEHPNNWYSDKVYNIKGLRYAWEKASKILMPDLYIVPSSEVIITKTGDEMFVHTDSPELDQGEDFVEAPDQFKTCHIVDYGVLIYYGQWTGGNIYYPELGIEISPNPGDLVIHKSRHPFDHGVRKIESGIRAAQSMFAVSSNNDPGTFILYGSDEYFEATKDETSTKWLEPK